MKKKRKRKLIQIDPHPQPDWAECYECDWKGITSDCFYKIECLSEPGDEGEPDNVVFPYCPVCHGVVDLKNTPEQDIRLNNWIRRNYRQDGKPRKIPK